MFFWRRSLKSVILTYGKNDQRKTKMMERVYSYNMLFLKDLKEGKESVNSREKGWLRGKRSYRRVERERQPK